jgi:hypothetical protein
MTRWELWRLRAKGREGHLRLMAEHLLRCAETINELRAENAELRSRGNRLADAIDHNDWTIESAERLSDSAASWKEFC